ncbi:MAG: proton-conducting membrane transporter [Clostridia bacterium]|nr:proton-conducting membrane transporter [Clostridia bacterium]
MISSWYLLVPVLLPILCGLAVSFVKPLDHKKPRNILTLAGLMLVVVSLVPIFFEEDMHLTLFTLSDSLPIFLHTDTLGKIFAGVMAFVWLAAGAYSFDYMAHEENQKRYYSFYLCTLGVLMAVCFAGSIVTFYMFYEFMTLLTVPMVMHTGKKDAVAAGIKYLIYSVAGASLVLLGIFLMSPYVTSFSFNAGGVLDAAKTAGNENFLLTVSFLMLLGFGAKCGLYPLHGWLPTAHPAAPSPASAVLSGIITKGGVLGIIRLVFHFVGADFLRGSWVQTAFMSIVLFTVFMGSLLAYKENLLKKRLAYSSVSQLSYVLLGIATLHPLGLVGALLHVCAHALIKNTLFMSAGAIIHKSGKTRVDELDGIGRRMPCTLWCFTIAGVGLVGIPPCLGFLSKWYLAQGALEMTGVPSFFHWLAPAVLLISALLTAGYLLTVSIRAFFKKSEADAEKCEAPWQMLVPLFLLAALVVVLGTFPQPLLHLFDTLARSLM